MDVNRKVIDYVILQVTNDEQDTRKVIRNDMFTLMNAENKQLDHKEEIKLYTQIIKKIDEEVLTEKNLELRSELLASLVMPQENYEIVEDYYEGAMTSKSVEKIEELKMLLIQINTNLKSSIESLSKEIIEQKEKINQKINIGSKRPTLLEKEVLCYLEAGYELHGGVSNGRYRVSQALVKYES
jgi:hypothetical protein